MVHESDRTRGFPVVCLLHKISIQVIVHYIETITTVEYILTVEGEKEKGKPVSPDQPLTGI